MKLDFSCSGLLLLHYTFRHTYNVPFVCTDISKQLACMKLGSRRKISLCSTAGFIQASCYVGYLVHTCQLPIDSTNILQ